MLIVTIERLSVNKKPSESFFHISMTDKGGREEEYEINFLFLYAE